jgi:hypothetical protein
LALNGVAAPIEAGVLYALLVFGAGFVLGTIRVLLVAPQLDENAAVLLETPIMLIASWYVCRWAVERLHVPRTVLVRSVMGIVGFAVLTLAELSLTTFVFGRSAPEQLQTYATAAGCGRNRARRTDCFCPVAYSSSLAAIRVLDCPPFRCAVIHD